MRDARHWALARWGPAEWFVLTQTLLPALLFLPDTQALRLPIRIASFLTGPLVLVWVRLRLRDATPLHPAGLWLVAAIAYLGLQVYHPTTNSTVGAIAQIAHYLCVISPLFWAPSLVRSPVQLRRLLAILLVCNGINAGVGVLQVYDPETWLPSEFSQLVTSSSFGLSPYTYLGPGDRLIVRPPGLFDTPGAVAGPAMFAALLGAVFGVSAIRGWQRLLAVTVALAGTTAVLLTQVRISMAVLAAMLAAYALTILAQRLLRRVGAFAIIVGSMVMLAVALAVRLGGGSVISRVLTLFEDDPFAVYYASRGGQLIFGFSELIADAPLGSGLARWGMIAAYFSDPSNLDARTIWAEIQLTGWMVDGGIVLVALYGAALVATTRYELDIAIRSRDGRVRACAAAVFAANLGVLALVFSFTPFVSQIGLQYWFLAGALHGVAYHTRGRP